MAHKYAPWWGAPKNFAERPHERKVSWLELFYDLVYVAAIAQLTHHLAVHPTWSTLAFSFLLFALIFWSWVNGSQYYDLHGSDSIRTRIMTFWQMLSVAAVAITISDAYAGHHQAFAIAFSMVQIVITYLWWSVGIYDPSHRRYNIFFTVNYLISFALLIGSVFCDHKTAILLWMVVLLFNVTPPFIGARTIISGLKARGVVFSASATLVERFGLFTIIVLAESVLGAITGIAEIHDKHYSTWLVLILCMLISFLLWSLYFDMTSEQETKPGYSYLQWLIYLHLPLLFSFSVAGACIHSLLIHMEEKSPVQIPWMLCAALATILFMIIGLTRIMKEDEEDRSYIQPVARLLIFIGAAFLIVPFFITKMNTLAFIGILAMLLFIPVFMGVRSWVRYKYSEQKND